MAHLHEKIDFTVAIFVVHDGRVLLIHHRKLDQWLPLGGHIELDEDPEAAALREAKEESGLDVELISGKLEESMLGLQLPDVQLIATMTSDGDITVLMDLKSFNVINPRSEHFRDIIPAISNESYQMTLRAVLPQDKSTPMQVLVALVDAEIILDIDAIVSVLSLIRPR